MSAAWEWGAGPKQASWLWFPFTDGAHTLSLPVIRFCFVFFLIFKSGDVHLKCPRQPLMISYIVSSIPILFMLNLTRLLKCISLHMHVQEPHASCKCIGTAERRLRGQPETASGRRVLHKTRRTQAARLSPVPAPESGCHRPCLSL